MLALVGKPAPYLLYAVTRIRSIFRKLGDESLTHPGVVRVWAGRRNSRWPTPIALRPRARAGYRRCRPNYLCNYIYELAGSSPHFTRIVLYSRAQGEYAHSAWPFATSPAKSENRPRDAWPRDHRAHVNRAGAENKSATPAGSPSKGRGSTTSRASQFASPQQACRRHRRQRFWQKHARVRHPFLRGPTAFLDSLNAYARSSSSRCPGPTLMPSTAYPHCSIEQRSRAAGQKTLPPSQRFTISSACSTPSLASSPAPTASCRCRPRPHSLVGV
ncbi:MAG: hypothetical protein Ct9H300mP32_5760 [Verrucomicrobiota bacterium]|nr:MAG: hypothetical protein Ct9H300mP32_5760 [Verrucomicrobiota bacterium]